MKPSNLFNADDRAVSPVIGVILMVAITVILAAVIGTFVLGLGDSLGDSQPTAQISVDVDQADNNVTFEHQGGDSIDSESLTVIVSGSGQEVEANDVFSDRFSVGDTVTGNLSDPGSTVTIAEGDDIRIRVIDQDSDSILLDRSIEANQAVEINDDGSIAFP